MDGPTYIEPVGEPWKLDPEYHKVSDFLGVNLYDRNDSELAKKVFTIRDWAQKTGKGKTLTDELWQIRGLQKDLGHQFIGRPLIIELYKTIRLHQDHEQQQQVAKHPMLQSTPSTPITSKEKVEVKPKIEEKSQAPVGKIEQAIQKVVQQTITQAVKEAMK